MKECLDELTVEIDSFPNSMLPTDDKVAPMALFAFFYIASFPYSLPYYTVPKVPHLTVEDERKHLADAAKALHADMPSLQPDGSYRLHGNPLTAEKARKLFMEKFPTAPLIPMPNPEIRARRHKDGAVWTPEAMARARNEFLLTADVIIYDHELNCGDELMKDERFQKRNAEGEITGLMLICPTCKTNDFVKPPTAGESHFIHSPLIGFS